MATAKISDSRLLIKRIENTILMQYRGLENIIHFWQHDNPVNVLHNTANNFM